MSAGLTVGTPEPRGVDWVSIILGMCAGASLTFLVGAQNGESVGRSIEQATQGCVAELGMRNADSAAACYDMQSDALNRIEAQRIALDRLAARCVLSVPEADRLRVTRVRDSKPFKVAAPAPASSGSAEWTSPDYFAPGDIDGAPPR
jgi:hypothetical protein